MRTWIYVRDIDTNYAGMVKARNDIFEEEGLSHLSHYIASTGIGGATEGRSEITAIDFLTFPNIRESEKTYLKALSHLSPTHDYGVAFERGVQLPGGHIFISGTASIDHRGEVLFEGDVLAQARRLLENISALLAEGGSSLEKIRYFVVYLRDISNYPVVDAYLQQRFPEVPRVLLEARVCRPADGPSSKFSAPFLAPRSNQWTFRQVFGPVLCAKVQAMDLQASFRPRSLRQGPTNGPSGKFSAPFLAPRSNQWTFRQVFRVSKRRNDNQSFSSSSKMDSADFPKYLAIFSARTADGTYPPASMELMVCRLTPTAFASSCWVMSLMARCTFTVFFISLPS